MSVLRRVVLPFYSLIVVACGSGDGSALFAAGSGGQGGVSNASGGATSVGGTSGSGGFTPGGGTSSSGLASGGLPTGGSLGQGGTSSTATASGGTGGSAGAGGNQDADGSLSSGGQGDATRGDVACGTATCTSDAHCCYGDAPTAHCFGGGVGGTCICNGNQCTAVRVECDGPEDCLDNQVCCAETGLNDSVYTHLHCLINCGSSAAITRTEICHLGNGACSNGHVCAGDALIPAAYGDCQ